MEATFDFWAELLMELDLGDDLLPDALTLDDWLKVAGDGVTIFDDRTYTVVRSDQPWRVVRKTSYPDPENHVFTVLLKVRQAVQTLSLGLPECEPEGESQSEPSGSRRRGPSEGG